VVAEYNDFAILLAVIALVGRQTVVPQLVSRLPGLQKL
jgi:hypothetical protein